jgi:hypothetical protein
MIDELEGIEKEAFVAKLRLYPGHLPKETEKDLENRSQDSLCPGRDTNRAPPEYTCWLLPLHYPVR